MSQRLWDSLTNEGSIVSITVLGSQTHGEKSSVEFRITYKDGSTFQATERLIREDGEWRLTMLDVLNAHMWRDLPEFDEKQKEDPETKFPDARQK